MQRRTTATLSRQRMAMNLILSACFTAIAIIAGGRFSQAGDDGLQSSATQRSAGTVSTSSAGNASRGKELYNASCVVCHGKDATGHIGPRLAGNAILANDQIFRKTVHQGRHMMPPLKDALTEEQIADILAWLRTLP